MVLEADELERAARRRRSGELETSPIGVPRSRSAAQQLARADHRLHPVLELGDDQRVQLLDQLRRAARLAEPPFQDAAGDLGRGPDQLALVGGGELGAAALEEVLLGPGPDRLGVEQQAVVVEDDRVRGSGAPCALASRPAAASPPSAPGAELLVDLAVQLQLGVAVVGGRAPW